MDDPLTAEKEALQQQSGRNQDEALHFQGLVSWSINEVEAGAERLIDGMTERERETLLGNSELPEYR